MKKVIGSAHLELPTLIPSVSSFETQFRPDFALNVQASLNEPITLVSAYDLHKNKELMALVGNVRASSRLVFMDSGGYEFSRITRYVEPKLDEWSYDKYRACVAECEADLVATFDLFLEEGQSVDSYIEEIVSSIDDHDVIPEGRAVPVIHLQDFEGKRFLTQDETLRVVKDVVSEFSPPFIAIPERELGEGIAAKIKLVSKIAGTLRDLGDRTHLHVLGCGNPLTFALLASAGAALADGLEWCRTLVGPDFKLYHFQQGDLFQEPKNDLYNPTVELARGSTVNYRTTVAIRNLYALQKFNHDVQNGIATGKLDKILREHFGDQAASYAMR